MYKILGADHKEYGPATADQLRQWMTEGRLNAQTLVRAEDSPDWKPLFTFPELAAAIPPAAPPPLYAPPAPPPFDDRKSKLVAGLLGILLGGFGIHRFYLGYTSIGVAQIFVTLFTCGFGSLWGFIEGILILVGSSITTDADGRTLKE